MHISASQGISGLTSDDAILSLTFTSSESTNDFDATDVICEGGVLGDFSGSGTTYTATFTPTGGDGEKIVKVRNARKLHYHHHYLIHITQM